MASSSDFKMAAGAKDAEPPPNLIIGKEFQGRGAFVDEGGVVTYVKFFNLLHSAVLGTDVRTYDAWIPLADGIQMLNACCLRARLSDRAKSKIILIGNGGSSAIASHMATDYTKNGGLRTIAFNDAPTLTCLGNDFGINEIFAKQLEYYALQGDLVIIVSSSGKSGNIIRAAEAAFEMGLDLVTFSGMNPDNMLRRKGMLNFYVPARDYGLVELTHLTLLHSVVSIQGTL
jgi:phosphoheptose isomerase